MRAFVTGASGFAGAHLVRHLSDSGDNVCAARFGGPTPEGERIETVDVDLRDPASLEGAVARARPDVVFHLAARTSVPDGERNRAAALAVNVGGTLSLLEAVAERAPEARVLVVSSGQIYAPRAEPLGEEATLDPGSFYGVTKKLAEEVARFMSTRGLCVVVARPFNHTGPGQLPEFVLPSFALQIAEAEIGAREPRIRVGNLSAVRDFLDVRDVVRAYRSLGENGQSGRVYNVCSGAGRTIRSLLDSLLARSKKPLDVEVDPARLRNADAEAIVGDASALREATGWRPEIPWETTLDDLLADARARARPVRATDAKE